MTGTAPERDVSDAELELIRERTIERANRVMALMLADLARDYERCGKAACVRSRRCRGFACETLD